MHGSKRQFPSHVKCVSDKPFSHLRSPGQFYGWLCRCDTEPSAFSSRGNRGSTHGRTVVVLGLLVSSDTLGNQFSPSGQSDFCWKARNCTYALRFTTQAIRIFHTNFWLNIHHSRYSSKMTTFDLNANKMCKYDQIIKCISPKFSVLLS